MSKSRPLAIIYYVERYQFHSGLLATVIIYAINRSIIHEDLSWTPSKTFLLKGSFFYVVKRSEKGYLLTERLAESKIDIDKAAAAALPDGRALLQSRGNPAPAVRVTHFLEENGIRCCFFTK